MVLTAALRLQWWMLYTAYWNRKNAYKCSIASSAKERIFLFLKRMQKVTNPKHLLCRWAATPNIPDLGPKACSNIVGRRPRLDQLGSSFEKPEGIPQQRSYPPPPARQPPPSASPSWLPSFRGSDARSLEGPPHQRRAALRAGLLGYLRSLYSFS